ncbi:hypothetical protein [Stenotrophomonas sp.]|uniref:hypothetical protein n=1 Tax=Stenotrophomonas sp. TaxID=69392 RepID=UPI0028A6DD11|nr:hypothetical protein [Stenotrophomonas sp.]
MNDTTETNCTCPSGNGSLRHPCPAHIDQRAAGNPAAAQAAVAQPEPYIVGNQYRTQAGDLVRFVAVHNKGTSYECMEDEAGVNRYTRRDFGRVTGTCHGYSDPRNTPPLYAAPVAAAPVFHVDDKLDGKLRCTQSLLLQLNAKEAAAAIGEARRAIQDIADASTPAAPGIDPADPWRGLYAPELMPKLDGVNAYHVAHPDLPSWPKGEDEERGVSPLIKAQGFELEAVFGEYPEDDDEDPDYCAWLAQWQPTPPTGEHWRLVCIQDTEDGPAAFYVRPFALIDASPKGDAPQDDRFPGGFADAIAYADEMEEGAGRLYEQVIGFEDGSHTGTDMLSAVLRQLQDSPKGGSDGRYFSADPALGEFITHTSLQAAIDSAESMLSDAGDDAHESGWTDDPPQICYGIVLGQCVEVDGSRKPAPEGSEFTEHVEFKLQATSAGVGA